MSWGTSTGTSSATFTAPFTGTYRFYIAPPAPPARPRGPCAHSVLGLSCGAPFPEVRRAYRRLARIAHPDLAPPERKAEAGRWMSVINRAYEALARGE